MRADHGLDRRTNYTEKARMQFFRILGISSSNAAPTVERLQGLRLLGNEHSEENFGISSKHSAQRDKFNDVYTSLMSFNHRHETLAFTDTLPYRLLGKAVPLPGFNEKLDQASMRAIEDRAWHGRRPVIDRRTRYTENSRMQFFRISVGFTLALLGMG